MSKVTGFTFRVPAIEADMDFEPLKTFSHSGSEYVEGYTYRVPIGDTALKEKVGIWWQFNMVEIKEPTDGNYACN